MVSRTERMKKKRRCFGIELLIKLNFLRMLLMFMSMVHITVAPSCRGHICLNWKIQNNRLVLICKVDALDLSITFYDPSNQETGFCVPYEPCIPLLHKAKMTKNNTLHEITVSIPLQMQLNGWWTCTYGDNNAKAVTEVTLQNAPLQTINGIPTNNECWTLRMLWYMLGFTCSFLPLRFFILFLTCDPQQVKERCMPCFKTDPQQVREENRLCLETDRRKEKNKLTQKCTECLTSGHNSQVKGRKIIVTIVSVILFVIPLIVGIAGQGKCKAFKQFAIYGAIVGVVICVLLNTDFFVDKNPTKSITEKNDSYKNQTRSPIEENDSENEQVKEEAFAQDPSSAKTNLPESVTLRQQLNMIKSTNESQYIVRCISIGNTLVLTDSLHDRLITCNLDSTDIHHIPLSYKPYYITKIDSYTVAVSCIDDRTILIINISTRSVINTIVTSGHCYGISYNDNILYVVIVHSIILVMDLTGKILRTIPLAQFDDIHDLTVDKDRLVCMDKTSIYCCSLDGKIIWNFKNDRYQCLGSVTTDNEGNLYATNVYTNTVIVVNDYGTNYRELLSKSDRLDMPNAVHFDKTENTLLVCNSRDGKAFLFDLKMKQT